MALWEDGTRPPKKGRAVHSGVLVIDKPAGMTSHDVVSRVRRAAGTRKVGHAGTLDPMATGVLLVGINSATRLLTFLVGADKRYTGTIRLGAATTTDDVEGEVVQRSTADMLAAVTDADIERAAATLRGDIQQVPAAVSAIKIDGRRAYARVRDGETVEIPARPVTIARFDILAVRRDADGIDVDVDVECSSGTYIRSLARDLGQALDVGGHLTALRRTRVGTFGLESAAELEGVDVAARLLSPRLVAEGIFPVLPLDEARTTDLGHGKRISADVEDGRYAALSPEGRLLGIADVERGRGRTVVNFPEDETREEAGA